MMSTNQKPSASGILPENFKAELQGKEISLYTLRNKQGIEFDITNYGGVVVSMMVPNKEGELVDIVLGHDTIEDYFNADEKYLGAAIGRYGNRIAKGQFTLDGVQYQIPTANPACALHGGAFGYHIAVWDVEQVSEQLLKLSYLSADGESGFPGNVTIEMTYELTDENEFKIDYKATTDKATVINLTHHSFFNLNGAGTEEVTNHDVTINAGFFTPTDKDAVPTGEILTVAGTPMDFRETCQVGARIDDDYEQLVFGLGYDHNYVLTKNNPGELTFTAKAVSPKTGISLEVYTTEPGVQFYSGNWLNGFTGKKGLSYIKRSAFCFETQHFPDCPNYAHFPSTVLRPGEEYTQTCIYKFGVEK